MTNLELSKELAKILPEYEFRTISDSIFGVKKLEPRRFKKSISKNNYITKDRVIFISGEMYPNTDKNFRYAINYTQSKMRMYRCKKWTEHEYEKVFVSGKTNIELLENIKNSFN